jgi:hypothetical protein
MDTMEPLLRRHGLISDNDRTLYRIAASIEEAVDEIVGFYSNYHSIRFVNDVMYVRMQREIPPSDFAVIAAEFAYLTVDGFIEQTSPSAIEIRESDHLHLARVTMRYAGKGFASLRPFIDAINRY